MPTMLQAGDLPHEDEAAPAAQIAEICASQKAKYDQINPGSKDEFGFLPEIDSDISPSDPPVGRRPTRL